MKRSDLIAYLDDYLHINAIKDYGPQGLQVETDNEEINRIALSVDVAPVIIETAAEWQADMLLVHHGIFWRNIERIAGPLGVRVRKMMQYGLNLYAAHLPLDAHQVVGNNAVLANLFGLQEIEWWFEPMGTPLGVIGSREPILLADLVEQVDDQLDTTSQVLAYGPAKVERIAILSGFGADQVAQAKALGADTYLTGERSHAQYWQAADHNINVIFAGHYATETVGVQALGRHLNNKFGLEIKFFDFPTEM